MSVESYSQHLLWINVKNKGHCVKEGVKDVRGNYTIRIWIAINEPEIQRVYADSEFHS